MRVWVWNVFQGKQAGLDGNLANMYEFMGLSCLWPDGEGVCYTSSMDLLLALSLCDTMWSDAL